MGVRWVYSTVRRTFKHSVWHTLFVKRRQFSQSSFCYVQGFRNIVEYSPESSVSENGGIIVMLFGWTMKSETLSRWSHARTLLEVAKASTNMIGNWTNLAWLKTFIKTATILHSSKRSHRVLCHVAESWYKTKNTSGIRIQLNRIESEVAGFLTNSTKSRM